MPDPNGNDSIANADICLLETGNFADATIVCADRIWNVHKIILGSRCKWFERAFFGNVAEAKSGKIVFEEKDLELVDMLLRFLYSKDINIPKLKGGKDISHTAKIDLCNHLYRKIAIFDNDGSKPGLPRMLREVFDSIREVYEDRSVEALREILLNFLWLRSDRYFPVPELNVLLDEVPAVGTDLMQIRLSISSTRNEPSGQVFRRNLPAIEAFLELDIVYMAAGAVSTPNGVVITNAPCLLRPAPGGCTYKPFEAVNAATNKNICNLDFLTPPKSHIVAMIGSDTCGLVQVTSRSFVGTKTAHIRFVSPGDAEIYIKAHQNRQPAIIQTQKSRARLEKDLKLAKAKVLEARGG